MNESNVQCRFRILYYKLSMGKGLKFQRKLFQKSAQECCIFEIQKRTKSLTETEWHRQTVSHCNGKVFVFEKINWTM